MVDVMKNFLLEKGITEERVYYDSLDMVYFMDFEQVTLKILKDYARTFKMQEKTIFTNFIKDKFPDEIEKFVQYETKIEEGYKNHHLSTMKDRQLMKNPNSTLLGLNGFIGVFQIQMGWVDAINRQVFWGSVKETNLYVCNLHVSKHGKLKSILYKDIYFGVSINQNLYVSQGIVLRVIRRIDGKERKEHKPFAEPEPEYKYRKIALMNRRK